MVQDGYYLDLIRKEIVTEKAVAEEFYKKANHMKMDFTSGFTTTSQGHQARESHIFRAGLSSSKRVLNPRSA